MGRGSGWQQRGAVLNSKFKGLTGQTPGAPGTIPAAPADAPLWT